MQHAVGLLKWWLRDRDAFASGIEAAAKCAKAVSEVKFHPEKNDWMRGYERGYKVAAKSIEQAIRALTPDPADETERRAKAIQAEHYRPLPENQSRTWDEEHEHDRETFRRYARATL